MIARNGLQSILKKRPDDVVFTTALRTPIARLGKGFKHAVSQGVQNRHVVYNADLFLLVTIVPRGVASIRAGKDERKTGEEGSRHSADPGYLHGNSLDGAGGSKEWTIGVVACWDAR